MSPMLQGFGFPSTAILAILAISALCSFVSSVVKVPSCCLWFKFLPSGSDPRSSAVSSCFSDHGDPGDLMSGFRCEKSLPAELDRDRRFHLYRLSIENKRFVSPLLHGVCRCPYQNGVPLHRSDADYLTLGIDRSVQNHIAVNSCVPRYCRVDRVYGVYSVPLRDARRHLEGRWLFCRLGLRCCHHSQSQTCQHCQKLRFAHRQVC